MTEQEMVDAIYKEIANKELNDGCVIQTCDGRGIYIQEVDNIYCENEGVWGEKISDVMNNDNYTNYYKDNEIKIIGHPVMIGDVLDWIHKNSNWVKNPNFEGHSYRNLEKHRQLIIGIYNYFIGGYKKPIEKQSKECKEFVYNLIK